MGRRPHTQRGANTRMEGAAHRALLRRAASDVWAANMVRGRNVPARWVPLPLALHQRGGGGAVASADGYDFLYDEQDGGDTWVCVSRPPRPAICFRVTFDREEAQIGLDVSYGQRCAKNMTRGDGTVAMLRAIMAAVFARPDVAAYKCLVVTDNSSVEVRDEAGQPVKLRLMDVCFVSTGCTWYGMLAPLFLRDGNEDVQLTKSRRAMASCTWVEFVDRLPPAVRADVEAYLVFDDPAAARQRPAALVLDSIRRTHAFLFVHVGHFLAAMGAQSLRSTEWVLPLVDGAVPVPAGDEGLCRHPSTGWIVPADKLRVVLPGEYARIKSALQTPARAAPTHRLGV